MYIRGNRKMKARMSSLSLGDDFGLGVPGVALSVLEGEELRTVLRSPGVSARGSRNFDIFVNILPS